MSENERIGKQMIAITKAAAQSANPAYRKAAERWRELVERQLKKDRERASKKQTA
jgi:hypothetical protein